MMESWRDRWLRDFFVENVVSQKIPADLRDRLFRKLQLLDDATTEADLMVPPGNRFERLTGKLNGWCAIRINERWRLIFKWSDSEAKDVYRDDPSYR